MNYSVIILAAGSGTRANLGYNKVLYELDGEPLIFKSINLFKSDQACQQIILTYSESDTKLQSVLANSEVELVLGGKTRCASVYNALQKVSSEYVFIHDGARPYLKMTSVDALKQALETSDAAILGVSVKDTIKYVENGVIKHTPERAKLWQAQTPQAFKVSLLKAGYEKLVDVSLITDDASLVENDYPVVMVEGDYTNIKVTTPEDFI